MPDDRHPAPRQTAALLCLALLAGCSALPGGNARAPSRTSTSQASGALPAARSGEEAQCLSGLSEMGARYSLLPDRYLGDGCTNLGTVQLSALTTDTESLTITNIGPVTCAVSTVFAGWARFGVDRAAHQVFGKGLHTIETFGSYSCRNVAGSSRRSGHATATAIDVAAFVLDDGRRIVVKQDWNGGSSQAREFLRLVRTSACRRFATVLSPDYNAAHEDHLHIEGVISGSSYCR
ncbi:MAG: extensin family protein [Croceibacterium sp.]